MENTARIPELLPTPANVQTILETMRKGGAWTFHELFWAINRAHSLNGPSKIDTPLITIIYALEDMAIQGVIVADSPAAPGDSNRYRAASVVAEA